MTAETETYLCPCPCACSGRVEDEAERCEDCEAGEHIEAAKGGTLRPLVVLDMDGGLVQAESLYPGTGEPELFVLDFDREGADAADLRDFAEAIRAAANAIELRGDHLAAGLYRNSADERDREAAAVEAAAAEHAQRMIPRHVTADGPSVFASHSTGLCTVSECGHAAHETPEQA